MKRSAKIPTLIGVLLLVFGVAGGIVLVNREAVFKLGAAPETAPKDVRITNVTDTSFTVSWLSDKAAAGFVKWGETSNLGQTATADVGTRAVNAHAVTVKGLTRGKTYFFSINSGVTDYTNNGVPWSATTLTTQTADVSRISGTVLLTNGTPADNTLIYVNAPGIGEQSTVTSSSGNWILTIPVSASRKETLLDVYAQGGANGIATAQVTLAAANPLPPISLGKTYDFRTLEPSAIGGTPDSLVTLPEGSSLSGSQSRFELSDKATPTPTSVVIVKSVDEGETIYTKRPELFGEGPSNTTLTITIHSEVAVTQTVKTATDGTWSANVPKDLEDGQHVMTISWRDAKGLLQTITKTFTVSAQENEPAFVSTPSGQTATPTPTATPTATPRASATPTPTAVATASASATPRVTLTPKPTVTPATGSGLPAAGSPLPTLALFGFGISLIMGGILVNLKIKD